MNRQSYLLVTLSYWAFMLTDGALRMLVLLHFHALGYSPIQLAFLFLLYEVAGILTNLLGGWIGARFGLKLTLYAGLALQTLALLALSLVSPSWGPALSLAFVMAVQALSGVSKDLTKMASKSSVKLLVKESSDNSHQATLFKWVAALTGSKNAIKGIGFFAGGFLLTSVGFQTSLYLMAALTGVLFIASVAFVRGNFGQSSSKPKFTSLFSKSSAINRLSFARAFLFASRDAWFVVGIPIFFYESLHWNFTQVGTLMAAWVIGYGFIQAIAPKLTGIKSNSPNSHNALARSVVASRHWAFPLTALCLAMAACSFWSLAPTITILIGLFSFGLVFAINSSIHSYLILAYTDQDDVSLNVGFYYMANACGRLLGTLISGAAFLLGGLTACLIASALLSLIAAISSLSFPESPTRHTK